MGAAGHWGLLGRLPCFQPSPGCMGLPSEFLEMLQHAARLLALLVPTDVLACASTRRSSLTYLPMCAGHWTQYAEYVLLTRKASLDEVIPTWTSTHDHPTCRHCTSHTGQAFRAVPVQPRRRSRCSLR
jgi:hypothetical protein